MAERLFAVTKPSFIADQLVASGSRITERFLNGAKPGTNLVEINADGSPVRQEDAARLAGFVVASPVRVAPIMPHAPNPIHPQAVPGQRPGGVQLASAEMNFVPAEGQESNEAAAARIEQLEKELEQARAAAAALDKARTEGPIEPVPPKRSGDDAGDPFLDSAVGDLKVDDLDDEAEIDRLISVERDHKNRSTAISALEARKAAL